MDRTAKDDSYLDFYCVMCNKSGRPFSCSRCGAAYCSPECQRKHWPKHKRACGKAEEEELEPQYVAYLLEAVKRKPTDLKALRLLREIFAGAVGHRDFVRARDYAKRAAECIDSELADWWSYVGLTVPYFGIGTPERASADLFLERAAASGDARAQVSFGVCLVDAARLGRPELFVTALKWLEKANDQGDAMAAYNIACHFYGPQRVAPGPGDALQYEALLRKAADLGHPPAMAVLSSILRDRGSDDVAMEMDGLQWQKRAADAGDAPSNFNMFVDFIDSGDNKTAYAYLDRAIALDFSKAMQVKSDLLKSSSEAARAEGRIIDADRLADESAAMAASAARSAARNQEGVCPCGRDHAPQQHFG